MADPAAHELLAKLAAWAERTSSHYFTPPDVLVRVKAFLAKSKEPESGNG